MFYIHLLLLLSTTTALLPKLDLLSLNGDDPFSRFPEDKVLDYYNSQSTLVNRGLSKYLKSLPPVISTPSHSMRTLEDGEIPEYVVSHCPLVHLYSEERYLPYDIEEYVRHFQLRFKNGTNITSGPARLEKLYETVKPIVAADPLAEIFMSTSEDFSRDPSWLTGHKNKPDYVTGRIKHAPATLVVVDKGNGWVDAYWFYFYSFNLGPFIMGGGPWGNHVGDWEHSLVRFFNRVPIFLWMSAHGGGGTYMYDAIEKSDTGRPVIFSARGTHANYPSVGQHAHDVPYSILSDFTDRGPLWDPALNYLGYTWDGARVTPVDHESKRDNSCELRLGGDWLLYRGHWGNDQLKFSDPRQRWCPFQWKYIEGPTGPLTKNLERIALCQRTKWWNVWHGCPVRQHMKLGGGVEREDDRGTGDNCGMALQWIRPKWLRSLIRMVTWGGGFCYLSDLVSG